jgi:hypothetical protein
MANHGGALAQENPESVLLERTFTLFGERGGIEFEYMAAFGEFEEKVPPARRLQTLVAILDNPYREQSASLNARQRVFMYLTRHRELKWESYPPLCLRIHGGLLSPEMSVRNACWQWLALEKGPEYVRPLLIAGLSDPDERVRDFAVWKLVQLGDALPLLEEYVRLNQDNPRWEETVLRAKAAIEKAKLGRPKAEKDGAKKP